MHSSLKKNKKVLILGASSDIGMTVIEKFLQEDWYVLATLIKVPADLKSFQYLEKD